MWPRKRSSKYNAKSVVENGVRFASTGEFKRWCELKLLEKSGHIKYLRRQIKLPIEINGEHICDWIADFAYEDHGAGGYGQLVWEDFKGILTPEFKLKAKLINAQYGINIKITGAK